MATDASQRPDILYPSWQNEYEAALLEPEPEKLSERVKAAEIAIYERLQSIRRALTISLRDRSSKKHLPSYVFSKRTS